ncbi:MAG: DNA mismatch repair endonuclease MutL [Candidatus Gracilibacteria bacterium]
MGSIHILSKTVQNHIAAGEVIERPLSVVKELVENSIDAKSTHITVELLNGGKNLIRVSDNGIGMDKEDAELSIKRHATSKISSSEDLFAIGTYGFRGEALSSISSISSFTLETKQTETPEGTQIKFAGDTHLSTVSVGIADGTSISVEDLFFNTPARKKYLKGDDTEYHHIYRYLVEVALVSYDKSFTLIHNGKRTLDLRQSTHEERIRQILGGNFLEESVPVFCDRTDITIRGFISKPAFCTNVRKHQYLFVNKRPVNDSLISKAVMEGYHRIIAPGTYPQYILFLELPPHLLDVNVHPRKLEVKFAEPQTVFGSIKGSVKESLEKNVLHPLVNLSPNENIQPFSPPPLSQEKKYHSYSPHSNASSPYAVPKYRVLQSQKNIFANIPHIEETSPAYTSQSIKTLAQLKNCYILAENSSGLIMIDQHAAHERILFEKLVENYKRKTPASQQLLHGEVIELSKTEQSSYEEYKEQIEELGYALDPFGENTYVLRAIPEIVNTKHADSKELFLSLLHEIHQTSLPLLSKEITSVAEKLLAFTACRAAVKFGDPLSIPEQEALIKDFFQLERRHTCPHGRTSVVEITLPELKKYFDR